jgi:DNA (cytosine-5)-methyltransferase 1
MDKKRYNVLDLFCGCGGLSKGFEEAGYNILVGVDFEQSALNTFNRNHHGAKGIKLDLSKTESFDHIDKALDGKAVDVIIGGPPCQGFSLTGPRNFDDERNKLYLAMIETVRRYQPKAFLIENVPGMANLYKGAVRDEIVRRFTKMGYNVNYKIVCAADYGVPQIRKRLVFIGLRSSLGDYMFPTPYLTEDKYLTCADALSDLPSLSDSLGAEELPYESEPLNEFQSLMRGDCDKIYNHSAINHKQFVKDVIALVPDGGNYKDLPEGVGESRIFHMAWTRLNSKKPARTVDTGHRNLFHYKWNRCPTVRESARIQTFPDDFVFLGNRGQQNKQVGNAVPVLLAKALAEQLLSYLK